MERKRKYSILQKGSISLSLVGLVVLIVSAAVLPLLSRSVGERRIVKQRAALDCYDYYFSEETCDSLCDSLIGGYGCTRTNVQPKNPFQCCKSTIFLPTPTLAPTSTPTPLPLCPYSCTTDSLCAGNGEVQTGYSCAKSTKICCRWYETPTITPTATPAPTATPTNVPPSECSVRGGRCRNECLINERSDTGGSCATEMYCCILKDICPRSCVSGERCSNVLTDYRCEQVDKVCCAPAGAVCAGISYNLDPSTPPANTSVTVTIDRSGAASCSGNWNDVRLLLDGTVQGLTVAGATTYRAIINSGNSGVHTLQFTINNGSCLCNNHTFNTLAPTATPTPTPICSGSCHEGEGIWQCLSESKIQIGQYSCYGEEPKACVFDFEAKDSTDCSLVGKKCGCFAVWGCDRLDKPAGCTCCSLSPTPTPTVTLRPTATVTPTHAPIPCVAPSFCTNTGQCTACGGTPSEDYGYCSVPSDICCSGCPVNPTATPTPVGCPGGNLGDLNCDNVINMTDLTMLLTKWGTNGVFTDLRFHKADIAPGNGDGTVNMTDLTKLLYYWGPVGPTSTPTPRR